MAAEIIRIRNGQDKGRQLPERISRDESAAYGALSTEPQYANIDG